MSPKKCTRSIFGAYTSYSYYYNAKRKSKFLIVSKQLFLPKFPVLVYSIVIILISLTNQYILSTILYIVPILLSLYNIYYILNYFRLAVLAVGKVRRIIILSTWNHELNLLDTILILDKHKSRISYTCSNLRNVSC